MFTLVDRNIWQVGIGQILNVLLVTQFHEDPHPLGANM